jgi:hypothetical protein
MNFICPKCHRTNSIEDIKIPEIGMNYVCDVCKERFMLKRPTSTTQQGTSNSAGNVIHTGHTQKNVKVVVALVCILFIALCGFGYYLFTNMKPAPSVEVPVSPSPAATDTTKFKSISTPKQPEQKQNQIVTPNRQEQPQSEVNKEQQKQAPTSKIKKPSKNVSPNEQNDSEEQRQYKKNQQYEKCRNQWCFGEIQGVAPVEAFKRCNECEKILR